MRRSDGAEGRAGRGEYERYYEVLTNIVARQDKGMKGRSIVKIVAQRHRNRG